MGNKNCVTKEYMKDNERFADVFNYLIFDGESVIKPEDLKEKDITETIIINGKNNDLFTKEKYRDVLKNCVIKNDGKRTFIILGVESQSYVDYAMPARNLIYDAMNYDGQLRDKRKEVRSREGVPNDEYLSGFGKNDKLEPVITLVVYFGDKEWDGPRTLHEMLNTEDEQVLKFVDDYKINIITPRDIKDFSLFSSDLKNVMEFMTKTQSKDVMDQYIHDNREFLLMNTDAVQVINTCAGLNLVIDEKEEKINMCKAWDDRLKEGIEIGKQEMCKAMKDMREESRREGYKEAEQEMCKAMADMRKESEAIGMEKGINAFVVGSKKKGESRDSVISDLISFYDLPEEKAIYYYDSAVEKTA